MSFAGVCQVCEAAEAHHSCERCGALVCREHFDRDYGMCVRCASTGGRDRAGDFDPRR